MDGARNADEVGPVALLMRMLVERIATARRLHDALGVTLAATMKAAIDDVPRLHIRTTATDRHLADLVRIAGQLLAAAKDARDAIEGAHVEAELASLEERRLARKERGGKDAHDGR
jgi:hypothetical protein